MNELQRSNPFNQPRKLPPAVDGAARDREVKRRSDVRFYIAAAVVAVVVGCIIVAAVLSGHHPSVDQQVRQVQSSADVSTK